MIATLGNKKVNVPPVVVAAVVGASLLLAAQGATAGTTGAEFQGLYDMLLGWMQGYLGRGIAIGASLIGGITGLVKSNALLAAGGFLFAIAFSIAPGVINGVLSAVI
jgi:conjugal transfer pilus assembly protein TraA